MPDASALIEFLLRSRRAAAVDAVLSDPDVRFHVPHTCDVEVASALRGNLLGGVINVKRAGEALADYRDMPLTRHRQTHLLARVLDLRHNMTAYDTTYIALAEALDASLLTADSSLATAAREHTALAVTEA